MPAPADPSMRRLRLYVSAHHASARLVASLSDGSASPATGYLMSSLGETFRVYTIDYHADKPGAKLRVRWEHAKDHGPTSNVAVYGAALAMLPAEVEGDE